MVLGLGKLLALPYSLPAAGIRYCLNKLVEVAEAEMMDDSAVKEELLLLNLELDEGRIDEFEYRAREAPLLVRLREIREYRKQQLEQDMADRMVEGADESRRIVIETPDELR
jgi:hypothetical protein